MSDDTYLNFDGHEDDDDTYVDFDGHDEDDEDDDDTYVDFDGHENYEDMHLRLQQSGDHFCACIVDGDGASRLARALHGSTHVKSLTLICGGGVNMEDKVAGDTVAAAIKEAGITHLVLSSDEWDGTDTWFIHNLLHCFWSSSALKDLEFYIQGLNGIEAIVGNILRLEKLSLINQIPCDDTELLCSSLQRTKTLKTLELCYSYFSSDDVMALSQALANNSSLTTLKLDHCGFDDSGLKVFLQHWHCDSQIHTLEIRNDKITAKGALLLIQAASNNPAMENLSLKGNTMIGYVGLVNIAIGLPNIVLKQLDISSCDDDGFSNRYETFGEVMGKLLERGMEANTTLVNLDMSKNSLLDFIPSFPERLTFYTLRNKYQPLLSSSGDQQIPASVWCCIFAKLGQNPSFVYYFLQEQPMLWQESHGKMWHDSK